MNTYAACTGCSIWINIVKYGCCRSEEIRSWKKDYTHKNIVVHRKLIHWSQFRIDPVLCELVDSLASLRTVNFERGIFDKITPILRTRSHESSELWDISAIMLARLNLVYIVKIMRCEWENLIGRVSEEF